MNCSPQGRWLFGEIVLRRDVTVSDGLIVIRLLKCFGNVACQGALLAKVTS